MSVQEIQIEAYSLFEFCQKVQENILNGFKFDFESNARFPTAFGTLLVCGMVKSSEEEDEKEEVEEVKEEPKSLASLDSSSKKVGRKTKVVQE
jgi:hypothetical protein